MNKLLVLVLAWGVSGASLTQAPRADAFAWQAPVQAPAGAGLARVPVPAEALAKLQTADAADLRLYASDGRPVPFAMRPPPPAVAARPGTAALPALPLQESRANNAPPGTVQVRVRSTGGDATAVWVQATPATGAAVPASGTRRLPAVVVDTRQQKAPWTALQLQGDWPANTLVNVTVATSADLSDWTPARVTGRIYRFEGEQAPSNRILELAAPLPLEGRWLRLAWTGQEGVTVAAVSGLLAPPVPPPQRPGVELGAARSVGDALEWQLPFATPIAELALTPARQDTLLPVRILGRNQVSEPWRLLAHTVVYRLGTGDQASANAPVALPRSSVRLLRVEATHGQRLDGVTLAARAGFDPVELVFVAGANGPLQLAAGRPRTEPAALPLGMLADAGKVRLERLPLATVGPGVARPAAAPSPWAEWLPANVDQRTATLWLVLLAGVAVLGAVAWSLLRQAKEAPPSA